MKNLRVLLSIMFLNIFIAAPALQAASPTAQTPDNSGFYMEINSTGSNATNLKTLEEGINKLIEESQSDITPLHQLFIDNLDQNRLGMSVIPKENSYDQDIIISMNLDQEKFKEFTNSATELNKEDLGLSRVIYSIGQDVYLTYKDGRLNVSNNRGLISDLLMINNYPSLSKNSFYSSFENKVSPESFFKLFINFNEYQNSESLPFFSTMFNYEGLALKQLTDGINGEFIIGLNPQNNLNFSRFQFTPSLYQKVSSKNLMLYSESFNSTERQKEAFQIFNQSDTEEFSNLTNEIKNLLSSNLNLNLEQDIAPLFQNKTAIFIHNDIANQAFPALTLITEVRGQEGKAQNVVNQLEQSIVATAKKSAKEMLENEKNYRENYAEYYTESELKALPALPTEEELYKKMFSVNDKDVNGQKLREFTFNMINPLTTETVNNEHKDGVLKLMIGVTTDSQLIFTTLQSPGEYLLQSTYSSLPSGLSNNQSIDYGYINFDVFEKYLVDTYDLYNSPDSYRQEFIDWINQYIAPLNSLTSSTSYLDNTLKVNLSMKMDMAKISNYLSIFEGISNFDLNNDYYDDYYDYSEYITEETFSDVNPDDWFSYYVTQIQNYGIMKGYENNSFLPNKSISRAEFIQALMNTQDYLGIFYTQVEPTEYFNDVPADAWYTSAINSARAHGIVKGFSDNTFRPNQPITRAEAVQILVNASEKLIKYPDEDPVMNFADVKTTDWFYEAVNEAYIGGIISGKNDSTFAPNDELTRAETAKILFEYVMNSNYFSY